jgi:branched-chain amino acid transport system permease protein
VLLVQRVRTSRADVDVDRGWRLTKEMRPIPTELRGLDVVRRWTRIGSIALVAVLLGLPWVLAPAQTNLAAVMLSYAMIGLSLLVLTGWAGQISLGQFGFAAVGGYVSAVLGWPFPISTIVGALAGAAVALVVGLPALRLRGLHLAISTLAFAVAVSSVLLNRRYLGRALPDSLSRPSFVGLDLDDQRTFYYFVLVFLILTTIAVIGMRRSRAARALIASRDNEASAQSFGINLVRVRLGAFAVSGFIAAFAGGLFAYSQYAVAQSGFGVTQSINLFLMAVIGGLGTIAGPLIGAAYLGATTIFISNKFVALGATGLGVVILLLFAPGGLAEVAYRVRDSALRRVADRYRIDVPSLVAAGRRELGRRAPMSPKTRSGGGHVFVPIRYRAEGQWAVEAQLREAVVKEMAND